MNAQKCIHEQILAFSFYPSVFLCLYSAHIYLHSNSMYYKQTYNVKCYFRILLHVLYVNPFIGGALVWSKIRNKPGKITISHVTIWIPTLSQ